MPAERDPAFVRGVEHFNRREFFDAHEAWEECWTSNFEKGLIQAAVALHHFERGNLHGARRLYDGFRRYIEPYRPRFSGLDLEAFVRQMEDCFSELMATPAGHVVALDRSLVPRIEPES